MKPTTIAQYIDAAPPAGQSHLRELYAILKSVAPDAEETIKWIYSVLHRAAIPVLVFGAQNALQLCSERKTSSRF